MYTNFRLIFRHLKTRSVSGKPVITVPSDGLQEFDTWQAKERASFTRGAELRRLINIILLKPNDIYIYIYIYICRTAALTSRRYILYIYSTNIHTNYSNHAA